MLVVSVFCGRVRGLAFRVNSAVLARAFASPQATNELGYTAHPDITALARRKTTGMVSSQCAEDTFNFMKNHKKIKSKKKYRRPQKCMAVVLSRKVLSTTHHFKDIEVDINPEEQSAGLDVSAFRPDPEESSLPFKKLVSASSSTPWPSPGASNFCLSVADLAILAAAKETGQWNALDTAWLGSALVRPKHRLLLRDAANDGRWVFAVQSWPDSAVLGFPATMHTVPGSTEHYWDIDLSFAELVLFPLWRLEGMEAVCYSWRAPSWQLENYRGTCQLPRAVRAFCSSPSGIQPLLHVAAECGFWEIERSTLVKLASFVGAPVQTSMTMFEVVFALVGHCIPSASDERILAMTRNRVALIFERSEWADDLLEVDEAADLLQHGDVKQLRSEQKAMKEVRSESQVFASCYKAKAKQVASTRVDTKEKKKITGARKKVGEETSAYPRRAPVWPAHSISIDIARTVVPEGGTLWRCVRFGNWQGHFKPYPRISRSWARYGGGPALLMVLRNMWGWWLMDRGLDESACPVEGTFTQAGAPVVQAASSST